MLLATKPTKDHFCSLLISNIYWLTSLSTDSDKLLTLLPIHQILVTFFTITAL